MEGVSRTSVLCNVCSAAPLQTFPIPLDLGAVTSDEKAWPRGGEVFVCSSCGHVQKRLDAVWQEDAAAIYRDYDIYHISGGAEKNTFSNSGTASRSARIIQGLKANVGLKDKGKALDIGAGRGAFLTAFAHANPGWDLAAGDLDDRHRDSILRIPGVKRFYGGPFQQIPDRFDLVSMIHVVEHIPTPVPFLADVAARLNPGGMALVQVPFVLENPFDLLIRDHCSHFQVPAILHLASAAGLELVEVATNWLSKEISLVLRAGRPGENTLDGRLPRQMADHVARSLNWLGSIKEQALRLAAEGPLHVLGTSIAGTWLGSRLGDMLAGFVEEDANRVGGRHLQKPILHPGSLMAGARVFLGFAPALAAGIQARLQREWPSVNWLVPQAIGPASGAATRAA